jgi:AhpD family alkylhydroperoxidase
MASWWAIGPFRKIDPPEIDPLGHRLEPVGHRSCSASAPRFSCTGRATPPSGPEIRRFKMSMLDWNTYRQQLIVKVGEIAKLSPDTIKGYQALSAAGQKTNLLGAKTRELISLAVAVAIRCDGCITVHTKAAIDQGATREEIAEALGVATAINAGAGVVYSARVLDAYAQATNA